MIEISTEAAPAAIGPYSQGIRDGDTVYVSGQGAIDPDTGEIVGETVTEETARTLKNIDAVLQAAGGSIDDVVKTTVFLTDIADYDEVNAEYSKHFSSPFPARSAVEVCQLPVDIRVEIEAIASIPVS